MTPELAKKLQDAGFPQKAYWFYARTKGSDGYHLTCPNGCLPMDAHEDEVISAPTLDEIIEACGMDFDSLTQTRNATWYASATKSNGEHFSEIGDTRIEAAANLYLALNDHA